MSGVESMIDQLLAERRPDRYEYDGGSSWLDEIAFEIEDMIPEAEARAHLASTLVRRRETSKTKLANKELRRMFQDRQLSLGLLDFSVLPVAVEKERVALRAMREVDFRVFARDERRRAASDFTKRNETCEAAEWLADRMVVEGASYLSDML